MTEKNILSHYLKFLSRNRTPEEKATADLPPQVISVTEALIVILDKNEKIVEFNAAAERLSGYSRQEMLGKSLLGLIPEEEMRWMGEAVKDVLKDNLPCSCETHWNAKDGSTHLIHWALTNAKTEDGHVQYVVGTGVDISDVNMQDRRRNLLMNILHTLASSGSEQDVLGAILQQLQVYTDCDAAGIRLRKGEDFPYAQVVGFSDEFLSRESSICSYKEGKVVRDEHGVPNLDCMCGRLIRGDLDETLVALTTGGAFYTGDINQVSADLSKRKLEFTVRNHCGAAGYNSIALIPLRSQDEVVGVLQLNDRQKNKFTTENIDFLTLAGQSIGTALDRFRAEQAWRRSEILLDEVIQKAQDGFSLTTPEGSVIIYNKAMEDIAGYTRDEVDKHGWYYLFFPDAEDRRMAIQKARLAIAGKLDHYELQITCKDGRKKPVVLSLTPLEIDDQKFNFTVMIDMFKRQKTDDSF